MKNKYSKNLSKQIGYLLLLFTITCFSCNSQKDLDNINIKAIAEFNKNPSFDKDIPSNQFGKPDDLFLRIKEQLVFLGFEKIDSLSKYFQIRITSDFDKSGKTQILSLRFVDNIWTGNYYKVNNDESDTSNIKFTIDSIKVVPKCGWSVFIDNLFSNDILYLPPIEKIPGFNMVIADGDICIFEIASENKYRFYYYYSPAIIKDFQFEQCKKIVKIFDIINKNINFKK